MLSGIHGAAGPKTDRAEMVRDFQKGLPPQDPYFLKNVQINRVTNFSSTFGPTESDSEKKLGGYLGF